MSKVVRNKLGKRLREARISKGWSQELLADKVDLHRTYISMIERGEQNVAIDNISKIAKALNLPLERLFEGL